MGKVNLEVYLFFKGNCKEAMEFYKGVFGGKLTISTMGEMSGTKPEDKNRIMHASLEGGDVNLMASDSHTASPKMGKVELSLSGTDEPKLTKMFKSLATGGKVRMPLGKQSWGDTFGMLTDKYGVDWMMNIGSKKD